VFIAAPVSIATGLLQRQAISNRLGRSGAAKWGGVPMRHILDLVKPGNDARYAVSYSLADGGDGGRYYDAHRMHNMRHYEMNGGAR
jgi:DMSO/TMAO reductase YedYZ molybdopterin-dependent catalytic subunit